MSKAASQPDAIPTIHWRHFQGLQPYMPLSKKMEACALAIRQGTCNEAVWLLEHSAIYTGGTSARDEDLLTPGDVPSLKVGRGGQWTWHGPGQRIAYVMLDLSRRGKDVRALIQGLEDWIISSLEQFGIKGARRDGLPGVWIDTGNGNGGLDKIAAVGIRVSRWVSWHGIAINVNPNLTAYDSIVPCGVADGGVTSLTNLGVLATMDDLDQVLKEQFPRFFPCLILSR